MRSSNLYLRIVTSFIVLSLLIGIVAGIVYFGLSKQHEQEFLKQISSNIQATHDVYQQDIYSVSAISSLFYSVDTVQKYYTEFTEQLEAKIAAVKIVELLQYCSNVLAVSSTVELFTYYNDQNVFSKHGVSKSKDYFTRYFVFEDYNYDFWMQILQEPLSTRILDVTVLNVNQGDRKQVIPIVISRYINGRLSAFVVLLSVDTLAKLYEQTAVFNSSKFVIVSQSGNAIYDRDDLFSQIDYTKLMRSTSYTINGTKYSIISESFSPFEWEVFCFTPSADLVQMNGLPIILAFCLSSGILVLAFALSVKFSKLIYRPIRRLHQNIIPDDMNLEHLKYKNELNDIYDCFQTIVDSRQAAIQSKSQHVENFIKMRLLEILEGIYILDENYLLNILREECHFVQPYIGCAIFPKYAPVDNIRNLLTAVWIPHSSGLVICVYNTADEILNEELFSSFSRYGLGRAYDCLYAIYTSFEEAADQYVNRPIEATECSFNHSSFSLLLRNHEETAAMEMIDNLTQQLKQSWPGYSQAKIWIKQVYDTCISVLGNDLYRHCDTLHVEVNKYIDILLSQDDVNGEPLKLFTQMTINLIPEKKIHQGNYELAHNIRSYIDSYYFQELSLISIAEQMNVSEKYVSRVFKDEYGLNLSDYIARVRVEHAKLLMSRGVSVNVAAQNVGIASRVTFFRLFKKIEGITPSEYIKRND